MLVNLNRKFINKGKCLIIFVSDFISRVFISLKINFIRVIEYFYLLIFV